MARRRARGDVMWMKNTACSDARGIKKNGYMGLIVDALTLKLQSKICYHRDSNLDYLEIKAMVDELVEENKKFQDEKMEYLDLINTLIEEKKNLEHDYQEIKEQVAAMEEQFGTVKKELAAAKHEHVAAKEELAAAKHEHVAAKEELVVAKEQLAEKNEELDVLRKKLREGAAMHKQLQQHERSTPGPEPVHSRRVTRSIHKREMLLQGSLLNDADRNRLKKRKSRGDGLEVVRQMLIKGFFEIDAGRYLGIKEVGKLDEKPFRDACAMKLPPSESAARASELYTQWQELINNPKWKPLKTVTVDGNRQEVIDVHDDKLQELKMAWGEGPYNCVIGALMERKEHNCVDIWNYKEGRKATIGEFVEHILDQLKEFKQFRPRTKYRLTRTVYAESLTHEGSASTRQGSQSCS